MWPEIFDKTFKHIEVKKQGETFSMDYLAIFEALYKAEMRWPKPKLNDTHYFAILMALQKLKAKSFELCSIVPSLHHRKRYHTRRNTRHFEELVQSRFFEKLPRLQDYMLATMERAASVYVRDKHRRTALQLAVEKEGNDEVILLLSEHDASFNMCDNETHAALLEWALKNRHERIVFDLLHDGDRCILDHGHYGQKTLELAADYGNMTIILWLASRRVNLKTLSGQKALMIVVNTGTCNALDEMISNGADVDTEFEGKTVLYRAAEIRKLRMVEILAKKGAKLDAVYEGKTAIFAAAMEHEWSTVKILAEKGANINVEYHGKTALFWLAEKGEFSAAEMLVEIGANVDAKSRGMTLLCYGTGSNSLQRLLVEKGADVNFTYKGKTALSTAASRKRWEQVKVLIDHGADVNVLVDDLPLLFRVLEMYDEDDQIRRFGLVEMVMELVREGINKASYDGQTAIYFAARSALWETVSHLVAKGANIEVVDNDGLNIKDWLRGEEDKQRYNEAVKQGLSTR